MEYALCPVVERCIEAVHAAIKRIGKSTPSCPPPHIVSRVREGQTLDLFRASSSFKTFVATSWWSNRVLDDVLVLRYSGEELAAMTRLTKIKKVYQCIAERQHESTVGRQHHRDLHASLALARFVEAPCPEDWRQCLVYIKDLCVEGRVFSVPRDMFDAAVNGQFEYTARGDLLQRLLTMSLDALELTTADAIAGYSFFVVTNARPEKRTTVVVPHLASTRMSIRVSPCVVLSYVDGRAN